MLELWDEDVLENVEKCCDSQVLWLIQLDDGCSSPRFAVVCKSCRAQAELTNWSWECAVSNWTLKRKRPSKVFSLANDVQQLQSALSLGGLPLGMTMADGVKMLELLGHVASMLKKLDQEEEERRIHKFAKFKDDVLE